MQLHLNHQDFEDLINLTANYFKLEPAIIEKDYWITLALYQLAQSDLKERVVFKGGTSLTKCYADLKRFSEDIDIALLAEGLSNSAIKRLLKQIEGVMSVGYAKSPFNEAIASGNYRYSQYTYPSIFSGDFKELYPQIRFELTSFMEPYPYEKKTVAAFVGDYLIKTGYLNEMKDFGLAPFNLNVLAIKRTVIEKLAALIRMSYEPDSKELLTKTRHLYDLYKTYDLVSDFYDNPQELREMVARVKEAELDSRFKAGYPAQAAWYQAPLSSKLNDQRIIKAYTESFGAEFVYGKLPEFKQVAEKIQIILDCLARAQL